MKRIGSWVAETKKELILRYSESNKWLKLIAGLVLVYLLFALFLGIYWSFEPQSFEIEDRVVIELGSSQAMSVTGVATTSALIGVDRYDAE